MKMTLMQHFSELRRRILWTMVIFAVAFCLGWIVAPYVERFLMQPLISIWRSARLLYTGIADGLMIRFSLATLVALIITVPALLWHIWAYVAPGLHKNEKDFMLPIFILSPVLFIMGAAFAFYILFPFVFKFFLDLNKAVFIPTVLIPAATEYLAFSIGLLKVFGIAFQLPLILVLLNRIGILSKQTFLILAYFIV